MCRCAERREVIIRSAAALARGELDMARVRAAAGDVARSAARDMRDLAAKMRLARASLRR